VKAREEGLLKSMSVPERYFLIPVESFLVHLNHVSPLLHLL
jgi:hypothetical protein